MSTQGAQSPLLFAGGILLHATGKEVRLRHATSLSRAGSLPIATSNICTLPGGRVAALVLPAASSIEGMVARVDLGTKQIERFKGRMATRYGATLIGTSFAEVYVAADDHMLGYALRGGRLVLQELKKLPGRALIDGRYPADQLVVLADGRVVFPASYSLHILAPGRPRMLRLAKGSPVHVAGASGGRVWFSEHNKGSLVLAGLTSPVRIDQRLALGKKIISLASGGGAAAAVVCHDVYELTCELVVVDETAGVRWRAPLPATVIRRQEGPFVAVSKDRVVLVAGFDPDLMLAWDAATGKPVAI